MFKEDDDDDDKTLSNDSQCKAAHHQNDGNSQCSEFVRTILNMSVFRSW